MILWYSSLIRNTCFLFCSIHTCNNVIQIAHRKKAPSIVTFLHLDLFCFLKQESVDFCFRGYKACVSGPLSLRLFTRNHQCTHPCPSQCCYFFHSVLCVALFHFTILFTWYLLHFTSHCIMYIVIVGPFVVPQKGWFVWLGYVTLGWVSLGTPVIFSTSLLTSSVPTIVWACVFFLFLLIFSKVYGIKNSKCNSMYRHCSTCQCIKDSFSASWPSQQLAAHLVT